MHPRLVAGGLAVAAALAAFAIGRSGNETRVTVAPALAAAPSITVTPAPVVVTAPPPVATPKAFPPRALSPWLDVDCIAPLTDEHDATCEWDQGFPAISADGKQIAILTASASSGQLETYDQFVQLIDVRTSRVVRTLPLLSLEESEPLVDAAREADREPVRKIVATRVSRALAFLDAHKFRSMLAVGARSFLEEEPSAPPTDKVYADISEHVVQLIDPVANVVRWRGDLSVPLSTTDEDCAGWSPLSMSTWWDPNSNVVAGTWSYRTGGCMCPDVPAVRVARM